MSKLSEIVFKSVQSKEFDVMGKKVLLKSLTTKDSIDLDIEIKESSTTKELLQFALKVLSRAIVSIEGITPDNHEECIGFLESQESEVVLALLTKYQELSSVDGSDLKNSEGTPS